VLNKKVGSRPLDSATNLEATHYNFVISETQPRSQDALGIRSKIVSLEEEKKNAFRQFGANYSQNISIDEEKYIYY
jgi:hypothetical protein